MNQKPGTLLLATMLLCGCVSSPVPSTVKTAPLLSRMDNAGLEAYLEQLQSALRRAKRDLRMEPTELGPEAEARRKLLSEIELAQIDLARVAREIPYRGGARATSTEDPKEENRRLCQNETDPEKILKGFHIVALEVQDLPIHEITRLINQDIASTCPFWRRPIVKTEANLPPTPISLTLYDVSA